VVLTNGQEKGLKIAVERYKNGEPYTTIVGYAGTGKTTLVKFIVDELKLRDSMVVYIAYTGKAALVLRNKGCTNTMTAHRLLYKSEELPDGTFIHTPKKKLDKDYDLIVCDEASMLPQEMIDLLLSHHTHVLFLGDSAQLPPIDGKQTILDNPDVFLTEITRQALDNPIIKLSMDIRNGTPLAYGGDKLCRVIPNNKVTNPLLLGADQIIVGKNVTRHKINTYMRKLKWGEQYSNDPLNGDKCICLKNNWNKLGTNSDPLINGQIGQLNNISILNIPPYGKVIVADFISDDGGVYKDLMIDYKLMVEGKPTVNKDNWKQYAGAPKLLEFAFAYAITCHKSQGSEFNRVILFEEWLGDYEQHKKWLYTGITRAAKQLVVVR
jgi:exodeoxyribonuclease-5